MELECNSIHFSLAFVLLVEIILIWMEDFNRSIETSPHFLKSCKKDMKIKVLSAINAIKNRFGFILHQPTFQITNAKLSALPLKNRSHLRLVRISIYILPKLTREKTEVLRM